MFKETLLMEDPLAEAGNAFEGLAAVVMDALAQAGNAHMGLLLLLEDAFAQQAMLMGIAAVWCKTLAKTQSHCKFLLSCIKQERKAQRSMG